MSRFPSASLRGGWHPDHDTIAYFRKTFLPEIIGLFAQVLVVAHEMGLLKLGNISLDGSKIHADASKSQAVRAYLKSQRKSPFWLVGGFFFLGGFPFGTRSTSAAPAVTIGAVVGNVEPRAVEDDGRGREHATHLTMAVRALLHRWIVEMLAALKMQPAGQAFVFALGIPR